MGDLFTFIKYPLKNIIDIKGILLLSTWLLIVSYDYILSQNHLLLISGAPAAATNVELLINGVLVSIIFSMLVVFSDSLVCLVIPMPSIVVSVFFELSID